MKLLSRVRLLAIPRMAAHQAPPSMGFSSQKYWSGLPLPSLINVLKEDLLLFSYCFLKPFHCIFRLSRKHPWRRQWQPTPVLLPGKSHGRRSLVGYSPWSREESLFTFMPWRRKWQPTPVFLPGESQGWGSLVGCRLWGRPESDTTEAT